MDIMEIASVVLAIAAVINIPVSILALKKANKNATAIENNSGVTINDSQSIGNSGTGFHIETHK